MLSKGKSKITLAIKFNIML